MRYLVIQCPCIRFDCTCIIGNRQCSSTVYIRPLITDNITTYTTSHNKPTGVKKWHTTKRVLNTINMIKLGLQLLCVSQLQLT